MIKSLTIIFILSLCFGCRDLVQSEFPEFIPIPVVNSILQSDSLLKMHVSLASKLDTNELKGVDSASVLLFIDNNFNEMMHAVGNGIFESSDIIQPNTNYECRIIINGYDTAFCIAVVPSPCRLYNITSIAIAGKDQEGMTYPAVKFTISNNKNEMLYFEARIRLFDNNTERKADIYNIIDPVLLNEGLPLSVFSNEMIDDTSYTMTINYLTGSASSSSGEELHTDLFPFILEIRSVSYDYYLFVRQKYLYDSGRFPEFGLSANTAFPLFSNVKNGYGIFTGYSSVISDTIYPRYN